MSHYIDTAKTPNGGLGRFSFRQTVEIIIGVATVVVLAVAAITLIGTGESPETDVPALEAQLNPQAHDVARTGSLIAHSALDPFELQLGTPHVGPMPSTTDNPIPVTTVSHSALDPFELRFGLPQSDLIAEAPSDVVADGPAYSRQEFH